MPANTITKVQTYYSERAMQKGIRREEARGWAVAGVQTLERGHGCLKSCLFGLFTLFMSKPKVYQVTFQKAR